MIHTLCHLPVAFLLGCAVRAAEPVPAAGHPGIDIPAGTSLTLAATANIQQIESPTALAFDDQGRIFITESKRSEASVEEFRNPLPWYLDDLAARFPSDRAALYTQWQNQIAPPYLSPPSGRVRRLADADGDGVFEESKVFADGFKAPLDGPATGIFAYQDHVYLACIPNLWMLRDTNNDGIADTRKVLQDGFGVHVSPPGHDLAGFTLGPDGRLYGTIGDRGLNLTTKDGKSCRFPHQGCAFRIEPDGSGFEVFHSGLHNPIGVSFDALGNPFTVDLNPPPAATARIIYLVEGGDSGWQLQQQTLHSFHRQIGLPDRPPRSWSDEHLDDARHPSHPAFILPPVAEIQVIPSGMTVHPGTGFLQSEAGRLLVSERGRDASQSGIRSYAICPEGAGMRVSDSRQLVKGMAASDVKYSWDGRLFIIDGGNEQIVSLNAGAHTWRAAEAAEAAKLIREDFNQRESAELAALLKHLDSRIRLRAQIALTRKPDALTRFSTAIASDDAMERIHGIWGLGILARRGSGSPMPSSSEFGDIPDQKIRLNAAQKLVGLFKHPDAETRAQALRAIGDAQNQFVNPADTKDARGLPLPVTYIRAEGLPFAALLFDDSPRVRYFAAIAIGKLKALGFYSAICDFLTANNNRDPYLRHAGAFALQHMVINSHMLAGLDRFPAPAVRLAATLALRYRNDPAAAAFIHDPDPGIADEAIRAVTDLSLDSVRVSLAALLDDLARRPWPPFMLRRLIHNAFRVGTAENAARLLKVVGDPSIPIEVQKESLRLLALWVEPPPVDQLTGHWRLLAKRDAAEIKPALNAAMPRLLQQDGFIRNAALELSKQYQLESPAIRIPPAAPSQPKP